MSTQSARMARAAKLYLPIWVAVLLAHGLSLTSGFVFDDGRLLLHNDYVRRWHGLSTLLSHSLFSSTPFPFEGSYYRPLSSLSYWCTWQLFHARPAPQHAVNIVLQLIVASLVARALLAFDVRRRIALLGGLVVAVHPVTAEIVDYLGGRQDLLGWAITLLCLCELPRVSRRIAVFVLAFAGTLLALFCREFFATSALLLAVGAAWSPSHQQDGRRRVAIAAAAGAFAIGVDLALRHAFRIAHPPLAALVTRNTPRVMWATGTRLLSVVFVPIDITSDGSISPTSAALGLVGGAVLVAALVLLVVFVRRRTNLCIVALIGASTILLSVLLPLYVAEMEWTLSDRYGYETLLGTVFLASALVERALAARLQVRSPIVRRIAMAAPFIAIVAVIPLTSGRAFCYRNSEVLAECDAETRPGDPLVLLRRAHQLLSAGHLDRAFPYCAGYLERAPERRIQVANCIGMYLLLHHRAGEAVPFLGQLAHARPAWVESRDAYFLALALAGRYHAATAEIARWRRRYPGAPDLAAATRDVRDVRSGRKPALRYVPLRSP